MNDCLFCNLPKDRIIRGWDRQFQTCFLIEDNYPVSPGHALIIPDRHIESWFDLEKNDLEFMHMLANEYKSRIKSIFVNEVFPKSFKLNSLSFLHARGEFAK